jgi:hypothetical protein
MTGDSSRFSNYGNYGNSGDYGNFTGLPMAAMTRGPVPACRGSRAMTAILPAIPGDYGNS